MLTRNTFIIDTRNNSLAKDKILPEKEHFREERFHNFPYGKKEDEHLESFRKSRMLKKLIWS